MKKPDIKKILPVFADKKKKFCSMSCPWMVATLFEEKYHEEGYVDEFGCMLMDEDLACDWDGEGIVAECGHKFRKLGTVEK